MSVDISRTATNALSQSEIDDLESIVAEAYGVDSDDLTSTTEYVTSGTISVSFTDDVSEEEALAALTSAMSAALGVDEDQIELTYDAATGEVAYEVATDDYDTTVGIQTVLQDSNVVDSLNVDSEVVTVNNVNADDEVVADVVIVVDADSVTTPLQQAENTVEALLPTEYNSETEGKHITTLYRNQMR